MSSDGARDTAKGRLEAGADVPAYRWRCLYQGVGGARVELLLQSSEGAAVQALGT